MTTVKKRHHAVATGAPNRIVLAEPQVLVLVGGTVDPTNFWEDDNLPPDSKGQATRSRGYSVQGESKQDPSYWASAAEGAPDAHDDNWYWETNPLFRAKVDELRKRLPNLQVFTMHGWTGDNAPRNREIAGHYLCDRLCGGGGEKAYYAGWLKRPVSFHLVGHSHGGNVVNEFTRRAASSGSWPAQWKIRSITFLSTPFFNKLHKIDPGAFHADCRVVSVFNKFDLTQRVVADFNLEQLNGVMALADGGAVIAKIKALSFESKHLWALAPAGVQDLDPSFWGVDLRMMMDPGKARALYAASLTLLDKLDEIFEEVHTIIGKLQRGVVFPMALQFVDRMCAGREVVSAALAQRFHRQIDRLRAGIGMTRRAMRARVAAGVFPVTGFIEDVYMLDFLEPFIAFLEIDKKTLSGPLLDLVHDLLAEQLVVFDNTTHTPEAQLRGTAYASKITLVEVTEFDRYMEKPAAPYRTQFAPFIRKLEEIERRYASTRSQRDLLDLLLTMAAQVPDIREFVLEWLDTAHWIEKGIQAVDIGSQVSNLIDGQPANRFVTLVRRLARAILNFAELFRERDVGDMQVPVARLRPRNPDIPVGSLNHFMRVSHSVSRDDLYPDVLVIWLELLLPQRKRGASRQGG